MILLQRHVPCVHKYQDQPLYSVERFDLHLGRWEVGGNDADRQCSPDS